MIHRPEPKALVERIKKAQKAYGLNSAEMAGELKITAEWLSKILNGHARPSYNIALRFEAFARRQSGTQSQVDGGSIQARAKKPKSQNAALRANIRVQYCRLRGLAGNHPERLALLSQKFDSLLAQFAAEVVDMRVPRLAESATALTFEAAHAVERRGSRR